VIIWQDYAMDLELRYTKRRVPRATRPDAVSGKRCYLIKNVPIMRLTYQVRLAAALAQQRSLRLVVVLPKRSRLSGDMRRFVATHRGVSVRRARGLRRWVMR